jgi:hypothetical protein
VDAFIRKGLSDGEKLDSLTNDLWDLLQVQGSITWNESRVLNASPAKLIEVDNGVCVIDKRGFRTFCDERCSGAKNEDGSSPLYCWKKCDLNFKFHRCVLCGGVAISVSHMV